MVKAMSMQYQPPSLIGASSSNVSANAFLDRFEAARAAGAVIQYEYKNIKPKKQLKTLLAEWLQETLKH